jgi:transcriptional regulator NrdR family protein
VPAVRYESDQGAKVKCLETRNTPKGFRRRRYLMDDGTRMTTYEITQDQMREFKHTERQLRHQIAALRRALKARWI